MVVLFDVDGVLVSAGHFGAWLRAEHGLSAEENADFFRGPFKSCSTGEADLIEVMTPFLNNWGVSGTAEEVISKWFKMDGQLLASGVALFDEVAGLGVQTGIATTQEAYRKSYLINNIDRIKDCDFHFVSCDLGFVKPEPDYYRKINEQLCQERVLFFDDIEANVIAAKAAGWEAFHYRGESSLADFGLQDLI